MLSEHEFQKKSDALFDELKKRLLRRETSTISTLREKAASSRLFRESPNPHVLSFHPTRPFAKSGSRHSHEL